MRLTIAITLFALFLSGCAAYKELIPKPEILSKERGFIEIKKEAENLKLEKEKKYFMKFPRPEFQHFYLLLETEKKDSVRSYFTNTFDDGKPPIIPIKDDSATHPTLSVFAIDTSVLFFYWAVDSVWKDIELTMQYRYVPKWRYIVENKHIEFQTILNDNKVNRETYNSINPDFSFENFNFDSVALFINGKKKNLSDMKNDLLNLESVFPPEIQNSRDSAYLKYKDLRSETDDELKFQENYLAVLTVFKKEKETQGNLIAFLESSSEFTAFIKQRERFPSPIIEKGKSVFLQRLGELLPYYDNQIKLKNEIAKFGPFTELAYAEPLFLACNSHLPLQLINLMKFVGKYNNEVEAFGEVTVKYNELCAMFDNPPSIADDAFYNNIILKCNALKQVIPPSEFSKIEKFGSYKCALLLNKEITDVSAFANRFATEMAALQKTETKLTDIDKRFKSVGIWPPDNFFPDLLNQLNEASNLIPISEAVKIEKYGECKGTGWGSQRSTDINKQIGDLQRVFQTASQLVTKFNALKVQNNFREIIKLLQGENIPDFLYALYPNVDELSLKYQKSLISANITAGAWSKAESKLQELHNDRTFLNLGAIAPIKATTVKNYEREIFESIRRISRNAVETFTKKNELALDNISALYKDSVFLPPYRLTFSSAGQSDLLHKRKQIEEYLDEMRFYRFPENAIKSLYKNFIQDPDIQGVEKARAILEHIKFYKGRDKFLRNIADEFDVSKPKLITQPKEYRKVYVLPVTNSKKGSNDFLFRLQLQIQSEAEYPVYDINIKLPQVIAENAAAEQWFKEITLDKKIIKHEGRIKITAPTAENDYECQISPVQMDKAGKNVLEVKFKFAAFKVFEVSVMAQKPIIKKN